MISHSFFHDSTPFYFEKQMIGYVQASVSIVGGVTEDLQQHIWMPAISIVGLKCKSTKGQALRPPYLLGS